MRFFISKKPTHKYEQNSKGNDRLWRGVSLVYLSHLGTACQDEAEEEATAALSAMLGLGKPKVGGTWNREVDGKINTCSSIFFQGFKGLYQNTEEPNCLSFSGF